jgi:Domain of unknown function (DUF4365)
MMKAGEGTCPKCKVIGLKALKGIHLSEKATTSQPGGSDPITEAARRALARNWPNLEASNPKYAAMLHGLSGMYKMFGPEKFELHYNLRSPKNRAELWTRQCFQGQITEAEFAVLLKQDAERPIDFEMLTSFHEAYQTQLEHYSNVLTIAVVSPSEKNAANYGNKERKIDEHVAILSGKMPLWRENMETVFDYLEELRVTSGSGLLSLGDFEATSAHWLAQLAMSRMVEAWRSCKGVSTRSRHDSRYLYAANAVDLFNELWHSRFPEPQRINERLREEFVLARAALKQGADVAPPQTRDSASASVETERSIDNESREQILFGEVQTIVGKAGHIFRPVLQSDWGIDGEIEFKDKNGNASGQRLYLQLKSGESYLTRRVTDDNEIFSVKKPRHLEYWALQAYPVMLVIRNSTGRIRWMDMREYVKQHGQSNRQIIFRGGDFTPESVDALAEKTLESL